MPLRRQPHLSGRTTVTGLIPCAKQGGPVGFRWEIGVGGPGHWRISLDREDLSEEVVLQRVVLDGRDNLARAELQRPLQGTQPPQRH